jgi:hypothetical protein
MRQSKYKLEPKVVNFWSPFTIGLEFPSQVIMTKKRYMRGAIPARTGLPSAVHDTELVGGLLLDLPDEGIDEYMEQTLDLTQMLSDEDLINFMENRIEEHLMMKKSKGGLQSNIAEQNSRGALNILDMKGFDSVNPT